MTEPRAILWGSEYMIIVPWRGGRCREARKGIDEGWDVAVILPRAGSRIDGPDADNDDGHHSAFAVFFAVRTVGTRGTTAAPPSVASSVVGICPKPKHAEEVEWLLTAARAVIVVSTFVISQGRRYAPVLQGLQKRVKRSISCGRWVVFAHQ
jgi:hypothetical protein